MKFSRIAGLCLLLVLSTSLTLCAQSGATPTNSTEQQRGGPGRGAGQGQGRGLGQGAGRGLGPGAGRGAAQHQGAGHDERHEADHTVFEFLLQNHSLIERKVTDLPNGVDTLTESKDPKIAAKIKEHVQWMEHRIEHTQPIRMRDPLFAEIFQHTDQIKMERTETERGVRVVETSEDPYVAKLIQAHAKVVSKFVAHGFAEAMKNHAVPTDQPIQPLAAVAPRIATHGSVVQLPQAAQQPRAGAKIVVDLTQAGPADELNPAIEKVAKYLNIYAGAGAEPATVQVAVVFHGEATLNVLEPDAYAKKFGTEGNPNLELLRQLHESGVELYVCGQSLITKGSQPEEVAVFVDTAVSALTAVVNLQSDGYAYISLAK
jgi:intracellular sulfur oxidation DsrE/DsrF family protein